MSEAPRSRIKKITFTLLPALLLFISLELAVRCAAVESLQPSGSMFTGHDTDIPYLIEDSAQGFWVPNRAEMSRFAGLPTVVTPGRIRVAAVGGSTVAEPEPMGPAWQIYAMLKLGSGGQVDLLNAAGNGFGSTRVLGAAQDALEKDLDGIFVYTGHNEFTESRYIPQLQVSVGLWTRIESHWKSIGYLKSWLNYWTGKQGAVSQSIPGGPLRKGEEAALLDRYQGNLTTLAEAMKEKGVAGVWVLPASNLSVAPEGSEGDGDQQLAERVQAAVNALLRHENSKAMSLVTEVLATHPGHALALYIRGRIELREGQPEAALSSLRAARDLDTLPRRATGRQVAIVREVANSYGIPVVDAEALLIDKDLKRYLNGQFSTDRMHLDAEAYQYIAQAAFDALKKPLRLRDLSPGAMPLPGESLLSILGKPVRRVSAATLDELYDLPGEHLPADAF